MDLGMRHPKLGHCAHADSDNHLQLTAVGELQGCALQEGAAEAQVEVCEGWELGDCKGQHFGVKAVAETEIQGPKRTHVGTQHTQLVSLHTMHS